jgi:hypothetical protein
VAALNRYEDEIRESIREWHYRESGDYLSHLEDE